jgi:phosphoglycerate dehydrogenase-like enzyme
VESQAIPAAALCGNEPWQLERVFALGRREKLASVTRLFPEPITNAQFDRMAPSLQEIEAVFATWGMDEALARRLCSLPKLKTFFHAAGSVQAFARPLLDKGITVVSAWAANAVPVAQFTFSQILLSLKGYFRNLREAPAAGYRHPAPDAEAPGVFGETVALLGCGMVGRAVAELLRPLEIESLVHDPFLADSEARALGLSKVTLEQAFAKAYVVSNHLPDLPPTRGMLGGALFASMRPGATFINTGRGATVVEADLAQVMRARPDLTSLLDVTWPEPLPADSPLARAAREGGNVLLSSHIAGSGGNEVVRLADVCLEEFAAWRGGKPLRYRITAEMLERLA